LLRVVCRSELQSGKKQMVISALILVCLIAVAGVLPGWPKATELKRNPMMSGVGLIVVVTLILVVVLGK
jgi:hypothetical protein